MEQMETFTRSHLHLRCVSWEEVSQMSQTELRSQYELKHFSTNLHYFISTIHIHLHLRTLHVTQSWFLNWELLSYKRAIKPFIITRTHNMTCTAISIAKLALTSSENKLHVIHCTGKNNKSKSRDKRNSWALDVCAAAGVWAGITTRQQNLRKGSSACTYTSRSVRPLETSETQWHRH